MGLASGVGSGHDVDARGMRADLCADAGQLVAEYAADAALITSVWRARVLAST